VSANVSVTHRLSYPVVDTYQTQCFGLQKDLSTCPTTDTPLFGQDAQYQGFIPSYQSHENGTVTDEVTGLVWAASMDTNQDGVVNQRDKMTYNNAQRYAEQAKIGGFDDWRVPTIKELYSLILFDGEDPSGMDGQKGKISLTPFINNSVLPFASGDMDAGERLIDGQYMTSTKYVSTTMNGQETVFGVNFIDGRIKGYGMRLHGDAKTFYVLLVRGATDYGNNKFSVNKNGTVFDAATGLEWQQQDSQKGMDWSSALSYCEGSSSSGYSDWRLPNVKELQTLVDYSKSPDTSNSASIDAVFDVTGIINEAGLKDYPNYWSSTTHKSLRPNNNGQAGAYVAFGRSMGYMSSKWMDVHGAGSQRSDPKQGRASDYPTGHGPQGDSIRIENYVRCVRGGADLVIQPKLQSRDRVDFELTGNEGATRMGGQQPRGKSGPSGRQGPPQEAFDACQNKTANASCNITTPRGQISGTCQSMDQAMVCVPEGRSHR
jgi:hypothetical protein